jgi:glycosyltransferase involved in cell wall biosynthesis
MIAPHPFFTPRGTPIAERELLRTLSSDGYKIDMLTYPHGEQPEIANCRIHRIPRVPGVGAAPPGFSLAKLVYDPILLVWAFRLARRTEPDVIHAVEEAAFIGILLRRVLGIPFVYDMDSSLPEQLMDRYRWLRPAKRILAWFERQAIRESIGVLAVCRALEQLTLSHSPGHFVRRAEDVTLLTSDGAEAEDLRRITGSDDPIVLYVGNLQPYQGIELLVKGFRHTLTSVPEARLVIIGGADDDIAHYSNLAAALGIAQKVHLIGPRSPDMLAGYLRQAQVLVSPRATGTNTPMKVYSYLDSGRPLVATRLPTHTQVLDDSTACLVDAEALAFGEGIARVLSDTELAHRLATRARELVQAEFTPESHRKKVLAFYDELVSVRIPTLLHGPAFSPVLQDE